MITPAAKELSRKIRKLRLKLAREKDEDKKLVIKLECDGLAPKLVKELLDHCNPNREEFDEMVYGVLVTGANLWDMVLIIMRENGAL